MESILAQLEIGPIIGTVLYSLIGIVIFYLAYVVFDKVTPFSVRKEIEEDQNVALGIIIGASVIAIALIIAAAIRS